MQYLMLDTLVCFLLLGSDTQMYSLLMEITNFSYSNFLPLTCQIEKKKKSGYLHGTETWSLANIR